MIITHRTADALFVKRRLCQVTLVGTTCYLASQKEARPSRGLLGCWLLPRLSPNVLCQLCFGWHVQLPLSPLPPRCCDQGTHARCCHRRQKETVCKHGYGCGITCAHPVWSDCIWALLAMVKAGHSPSGSRRGSPAAVARSARSSVGLAERESKQQPSANNILTKFAQCTVKSCTNRKQAGTPRCQWHNNWLYRVPLDTLSCMFDRKLASFTSMDGGGGGDGGGRGEDPDSGVDDVSAKEVRDAKEHLRAVATHNFVTTKRKLEAALSVVYEAAGVAFQWPPQVFVEQRLQQLQPFLTAVARELAGPASEADEGLDISDEFAVDAVVERMYKVRVHSASLVVQQLWPCARPVGQGGEASSLLQGRVSAVQRTFVDWRSDRACSQRI
jgi:hypothetical protein